MKQVSSIVIYLYVLGFLKLFLRDIKKAITVGDICHDAQDVLGKVYDLENQNVYSRVIMSEKLDNINFYY